MSTAILARPNAFRLIGLAGWAVAAVLVATLAAQIGLASRLVGLLAPAGLACLLATAYLRQLITGRDRLVLIEDAMVAGGVLIGVCALLGQPVRVWADLIAIGLAVFVGIGRIGCLVAGCCHGRPARIGLAYRHPAPAGPPVGIPLVPVPLIESAGLLGLVAAAVITLGPAPPAAPWPESCSATACCATPPSSPAATDCRAERTAPAGSGRRLVPRPPYRTAPAGSGRRLVPRPPYSSCSAWSCS